jgi:hypothetical protein
MPRKTKRINLIVKNQSKLISLVRLVRLATPHRCTRVENPGEGVPDVCNVLVIIII